jgi:hypothetical protein
VPGREQCDGTACRAGRQRCNGAQIEVCREDRSGFDKLGEPCASAALCIAGESDVARCATQSCAPGTFSCDGATLMRCSDDATSQVIINQCSTPAACLAAEQRCADSACTPSTQRCTGAVLERCNAGGTAFEPVLTCVSPTRCDAATSACVPGSVVDPPPDPAVLSGPDYSIVEASTPTVLGLGPMTLRLPAEWSSVDETPWTNASGATIGPRFVASSDAARFARNFDIPGVYFAATEAAPVNVAQRQTEFDLSTRCTKSTSEPYEDDLYEGTTQTWTNCGVTKATTAVVVALDKDQGRFVTIVAVTSVASRDVEARTEIWNSFEVEP